jgi:hypothetical protein
MVFLPNVDYFPGGAKRGAVAKGMAGGVGTFERLPTESCIGDKLNVTYQATITATTTRGAKIYLQ